MTSSVWNNLKSKLLTDFRTILNCEQRRATVVDTMSAPKLLDTVFAGCATFCFNLVWCVAAGLSVQLRWPRFSFLLSSDCWGFSVLQHKTV